MQSMKIYRIEDFQPPEYSENQTVKWGHREVSLTPLEELRAAMELFKKVHHEESD